MQFIRLCSGNERNVVVFINLIVNSLCDVFKVSAKRPGKCDTITILFRAPHPFQISQIPENTALRVYKAFAWGFFMSTYLLMRSTTTGMRKPREGTLRPSMFQENSRKRWACCLSTVSRSSSGTAVSSTITTSSSVSEVKSMTGALVHEFGVFNLQKAPGFSSEYKDQNKTTTK